MPSLKQLALSTSIASFAPIAACDAPVKPEPKVTWTRDVLPLAQDKCMACHVAGGIAPFSMTDLPAVTGYGEDILEHTQSGKMPPWQPADDCRPLVGVRRLSDDEKALFQSWADEGFAPGDPQDAPPAPAARAGLARVDLESWPEPPYEPKQDADDDYHCFPVDPLHTDDVFVTGVDVRPGRTALVHHVLLFAASRREIYQRDAEELEPGWTCFGGPDLSGEPKVIGAYAPGTPPTVYPEGTGLLLGVDEILVMQVHYNLQHGDVDHEDHGGGDTTIVQLMTEPTVPKAAQMLLVGDYDFVIPAGASDVYGGTTVPGYGATLYGALPHMHTFGKRIKVTTSDPQAPCIVDIPQWDFHRQQGYYLQEPVTLAPGASVTLECTWDNPTNHDVRYGEGTGEEMCLFFAYVTLP